MRNANGKVERDSHRQLAPALHSNATGTPRTAKRNAACQFASNGWGWHGAWRGCNGDGGAVASAFRFSGTETMGADLFTFGILWLLFNYAAAIILVGVVAQANAREAFGWAILAVLVTPPLALLALIGLGQKQPAQAPPRRQTQATSDDERRLRELGAL